MQPPQSTTDPQFEFPPELCAKPLALIGFSGLDITNNAVHKTIWCDFRTNDKMQRVAAQFKLLNNAHEFPVLKPKRTSYEWYIPKGILKRNWMNKHLNEIPAVIVIFYDLDWNDSNWNEKLIEISSRVHSMRHAVEGRNTRIVVVLIQQVAPVVPGEDVLATDRATALCASCELNSEHLFALLPHDHHLVGYISRLENAFYELAQGYYQQETRNIKSHREHLNKTTHQYLFVRYEFKMGFLSELKQDHHTANKHYVMAYNNLQELRIVDTNALEIRTVAGFINYKLCRVLFTLRLPRDAISHFKAHIDRYKSRSGFKELSFEHHAWLSKQFSAFGDLFHEVINLFPMVQTQHPGFYYQQAAAQAILRKKACMEMKCKLTKYPEPDPLEGMNRLEHYGQRPWRAGKLSAEPPDPALEQLAIEALQWKERHTVNHSSLIINLYGSAILHFKTNKCPRMRSSVVVQMADEYCNSGDFGKALTLLTHMLWDYRSEKWFSILTNLLRRVIYCAQVTASVQEFILFSMEALSDSISLPPTYKTTIYENLQNVLQKKIPNNENGKPLPPNTQQLWKTVNSSTEPLLVTIEMNNIALCMQTKARFLETSYPVNEEITAEIITRSCTSQKITLSQICVLINSPNYSKEIKVEEHNFTFEPNETKKFSMNFKPDMLDAGKEIQISGVLLYMGSGDRRAVLKFSGLGNEVYIQDHTYPEFLCLSYKHNSEYFGVQPRTNTLVQQRTSNLELTVENAAPALIGEWFPMLIKLKNGEGVPLKDLKINIRAKSEFAPSRYSLCTDYKTENKLPEPYEYKHLNKNDTKKLLVYFRAHDVMEVQISIQITYVINLTPETECPCLKDHMFSIRAVKPFDFICKFFTRFFQHSWQLFLNEEFIMSPSIINLSPVEILIEKASLETGAGINILENIDQHIQNLSLHPDGAEYSDLYLAFIPKTSKPALLQSHDIGQYSIYWKRKGSNTPMNVTKFPIGWNNTLQLKHSFLKIDLDIDAHATVLKPLPTIYTFTNNTTELILINVVMEASDAFMFAGYNQRQISILPESKFVLNYILYPLVSGKVSLPKLHLSVPDQTKSHSSITQTILAEVMARDLRNEIYVLPQVRGNPQSIIESDIQKLAITQT